jgi:hypothetical protein
MQLPRFSGKPLSRSVEAQLVEKVLEAFNGAFVDASTKKLQVTGVIVAGHEKLCKPLLYNKLPADIQKSVLKVRDSVRRKRERETKKEKEREREKKRERIREEGKGQCETEKER